MLWQGSSSITPLCGDQMNTVNAIWAQICMVMIPNFLFCSSSLLYNRVEASFVLGYVGCKAAIDVLCGLYAQCRSG